MTNPPTSAANPAPFTGVRRVPDATNEPIKDYAPGSPEKAELKAELKRIAGERIEIPLVIGGKEIRTKETAQAVMPHDHGHVLADVSRAEPKHVEQAIKASAEAAKEWGRWSWADRSAVFLRAAELLATSWRQTINAATMLNQSKTAYQAEIDAAVELIDFWRFNLQFAQGIVAAGGVDQLPVARPAERQAASAAAPVAVGVRD